MADISIIVPNVNAGAFISIIVPDVAAVTSILIILPSASMLGEELSKSTIFPDVNRFPLTRTIRPVVTLSAVMSNTAPVVIAVASVSKCTNRPLVKPVPPSTFNKLPVAIAVALISTILPAASLSPCTCNKCPSEFNVVPSPDVICNAFPLVNPFVLIFIPTPVVIALAVNRTRPSALPCTVVVLKSINVPLVSLSNDSTVIADPDVNSDAFMYNIVPSVCFSPCNESNVPFTCLDIVQPVWSFCKSVCAAPSLFTNVISLPAMRDILYSPLLAVLKQLCMFTMSDCAYSAIVPVPASVVNFKPPLEISISVILIMSIGISVPSAILDILQPVLSVPVIIGMLSYILTNVMT